MNDQLRHTNMNANPTKSDLLRELGRETGMARRQGLMKAIWRLDRQGAQPISPQSPVEATVKSEVKMERRRFASVQKSGRRANDRTDSPNETATPQNAEYRSRAVVNDEQTLAALNQLYTIQRFSLANYLQYAKPWVPPGDQCLAEAIRHIGDRQREFSDRVGSLLIERRSHVVGGSFPFRFTGYNDLSVAFLAPRVMEDQERIVRQVRAIAHQLRADVAACDLATEIRAAEQAHLDTLRQLLGGPKSEPCRESAVAPLGERHREDTTHNIATAA